MSRMNTESLLSREHHDEYHDTDYTPAPCQAGCPVGTDIPSYVGLIAGERFEEAFGVISATNPFSTICGRVCAMPCESRCRRGESDGAVSIRNLKRFVTDKMEDWTRLPEVPVSRSKTVAIVGGGPAGLTAALDLAEDGFEVHIYEKSDSLGGMMTLGIPLFRLPRTFVKRDIDRILKHCPGIKVHLNSALGNQVSLEELKAKHDAVLLAIGLWQDRSLGLPGEEKDLEGLYGIDFLMASNQGGLAAEGDSTNGETGAGGPEEAKPVPLTGTVVVVGGGNVAIDAARTALRAGADRVELFCLEKREEMPAWNHEIEEALDEGIIIHPSRGPKRILHEGGKVTGIEFMRCTSVFDVEGRFNPAFDPKATRTVEATAVITAIGLAAHNTELERIGLLEKGRVKADFESMRTSDPKVFAAGDGAFGPSAIVYAIHHGHRAAHYLKAFLEDRDAEPYRIAYGTRGVPVIQDPMWEKLPREEQTPCGAGQVDSLTAECRLTYDWDAARRQAARCLRCDTETGTSDYSRRTREHIHAMARTEPGDLPRLRELLRARLKPRDNPFPPERPAQLDDLVFLPAALTRLVIDPYREHCSTATPLGKSLSLGHPCIFTGFDHAPGEVRESLLAALATSGCGYMGFRDPREGTVEGSTGSDTPGVPWLRLVMPNGYDTHLHSGGCTPVRVEVSKHERAVDPHAHFKGNCTSNSISHEASTESSGSGHTAHSEGCACSDKTSGSGANQARQAGTDSAEATSVNDGPAPGIDADALIYVLGSTFRPVNTTRAREGQLLGLCVKASALSEAIPYALENGFDLLLLDGTRGIEQPGAELEGTPDLTVIRDALRILRKLNREEEIDLLYFGGLRSGTDIAKILAVNCRAGVFGVAMGIAMGGVIDTKGITFENGLSVQERRKAAENWIKGTAQETAIIARCTGKTNVHNLEPEDMRTITLATADATDIPLASGRPPREYF